MPAALTHLIAFLLGTIAAARATRLLLHDSYPPAAALRRWWWHQTIQKGGWREGWAPLLTDEDGDSGCPFCATPYVTALILAVAVWAGVWSPDLNTWAGWWWVLAVWASGSYLASMIVVRDEPPEQ